MINPNLRNPFGYITGPHYVYVIGTWVGSEIVPIYVGRGRGDRAKNYFRVRGNYLLPKTHNPGLNMKMAEIRKRGQELTINAEDFGSSLFGAKQREKELIAKHGRIDKGTGTLFNRNSGG